MNQTYRSPSQSANKAVDNLATNAEEKISSAIDLRRRWRRTSMTS